MADWKPGTSECLHVYVQGWPRWVSGVRREWECGLHTVKTRHSLGIPVEVSVRSAVSVDWGHNDSQMARTSNCTRLEECC